VEFHAIGWGRKLICSREREREEEEEEEEKIYR
jgi:hypothetical protein